MKTVILGGVTWVFDERGNGASVDIWGSEDLATEALRSCSNCSNCVDCSNCSNCSYCRDCAHCLGCHQCSGCSSCLNCYNCSNCSYCSDSHACYYCSACSDCFSCSSCSNYHPCHPNITQIPGIHQKIYEAASQPGALDMNYYHKCETTHCRAGWAIHLAGEVGYQLEKETSSVFAAMQIYKASGYLISPAKFFASNDEALEDMQKLAVTDALTPRIKDKL